MEHAQRLDCLFKLAKDLFKILAATKSEFILLNLSNLKTYHIQFFSDKF